MERRVIVDYNRVDFAAPRRAPRRRGRVIAVIVIVAGLMAGGYVGGRAVYRSLHNQPTTSSHPLSAAQVAQLQEIPNPLDERAAEIAARTKASPSPIPPPVGKVLAVPYSVQAPGNNWKEFENACEEDALLMYHDFLEGDHRDTLPAAEVAPQLRTMQQWQRDHWGAERDLDIATTGKLAEQYYGYHYEVIPATEDRIRAAIAGGQPVIIPVMTHSLQNHNYGPQTVYHEVLIKGYTAGGVVTNDGGVKEGKDWFYSWDIMFQAIDAQSSKMSQGRVALILQK